MVNILSTLMVKGGNMQDKMGDVSREKGNLRKIIKMKY